MNATQTIIFGFIGIVVSLVILYYIIKGAIKTALRETLEAYTVPRQILDALNNSTEEAEQ